MVVRDLVITAAAAGGGVNKMHGRPFYNGGARMDTTLRRGIHGSHSNTIKQVRRDL
jgi:hypothetical protein